MKEIKQNEDGTLLSVRDLFVAYHSGGETIHAVNGVTFDLKPGETIGLVGETGAGKTSIAKAILRILPDHATRRCDGIVEFEGQDIASISEKEMCEIRGHHISMIFQDPMTALNPVKTVQDQIAESILVHQNVNKTEARKRAREMLEIVGISEDRACEYPHQFSGGMKQRVVIALALACYPDLLIADEPTTALDVTIQAQVLDLIEDLRKQYQTAMILITHDLGVVARACDKVAVVYAGQIVESGSKYDIFKNPSHPYTKGLFAALPDLSKNVKRLSPIEGLPPDPTNLPAGCPFSPRCSYATDACREGEIRNTELHTGHLVRCLHADKPTKGGN